MDAIDMEAGVTELDEIFEHSILNKLLEELDDDTTQDMDAIMEENDCVNIAGVENDCGKPEENEWLRMVNCVYRNTFDIF